MSNRFSYTPSGDKAKFATHYPRLLELMKGRFAPQLQISDAHVMFWDSERCCVVIQFAPHMDEAFKEGIHNYIFGFFEALGF